MFDYYKLFLILLKWLQLYGSSGYDEILYFFTGYFLPNLLLEQSLKCVHNNMRHIPPYRWALRVFHNAILSFEMIWASRLKYFSAQICYEKFSITFILPYM